MKNKVIKIPDGTRGFTGVYKFTTAKIVTPEQIRLHALIEKLRGSGEYYLDLVRRLNEICETRTLIAHNVVTTDFKAVIMNNATSATPANSMLITKAALGTGSNTPNAGDHALQTEAYRNNVASRTNASAVGYITGFFSATECQGHFLEAGVLTDDDILASHVALDIEKSLTESLTLDWSITAN